ncbi:hypothetical protein E2C01_042681 [Portunus trituberculatus]|uniref:CCHC-type domain-containing protein n=1 Tax=Portunus trituberculatus TaxID=210409 RepID=A0A5B7FU77_PORTR|nr:hypothetical protein [Portunus trituberculatus]
MEMSTTAFQLWRSDGGCPAHPPPLHSHSAAVLGCQVHHRATEEWQALGIEEALDSIGHITLQVTNQAADWYRFFTMSQEPSESISKYFTWSPQCAADCEFQCPNCDSNLSEYMLLRKLVSGLESVMLKEVFRKCESFGDVDSSCKFCVAFKAAPKDAACPGLGRKFWWKTLMLAIAVTLLLDTQQESVLPQATGICQLAHKPHCGNFWAIHKPAKGSCPAEMQMCYNCGKISHLCKVCKGRVKKAAVTNDVEASGESSGPAMHLGDCQRCTAEEDVSQDTNATRHEGPGVCGWARTTGYTQHQSNIISVPRMPT